VSRALRLTLQAALGAALVLIGLRLWWTSESAGAYGALLSDVGRPISLAVTSVNSARRSPLRNAALVTHIVNALPTTSQLLVLTNDRAAFDMQGGAYPGRVRFIELDAESLTIWPQDPFLVLHDEDGEGRLLVPRRFDRADDRRMAGAVAADQGWPIVESELLFEGGNIVSDDTDAFIGADTIRANALELGVDPDEAAARFERVLGRRVHVIGPTPQPVPHIDLVLTPLGDGRIALADPGHGADIVGAVAGSAPGAITAFETRAEAVFFGHTSIRELPTVEGEPLRAPAIADRTQEIIDYARTLAPVFDRLARELTERGFDVVRVPALLAPPEEATEVEGDRGAFAPGYPLLAYHNVLLEQERDDRVVYLPRYGLGALDDAAALAWRRAGYRIVVIDGLLTSASYGGGLRCSVKVLARR